ncbi:hypothetical protein OGATHE_004896, partial [Ogataea polymorpha]
MTDFKSDTSKAKSWASEAEGAASHQPIDDQTPRSVHNSNVPGSFDFQSSGDKDYDNAAYTSKTKAEDPSSPT